MYKSIKTHLIALHVNGDNKRNLDNFRDENVPKEVKKIADNKVNK